MYPGKSPQQSQIDRSCETVAVRPFIHPCQHDLRCRRKVAPVSKTRQSAMFGTDGFISLRSFDCACAALRWDGRFFLCQKRLRCPC